MASFVSLLVCIALVFPGLLANPATSQVDELITAVQEQVFNAVGIALSEGVDPNQPGSKGHLALIEAVKLNEGKIVDLLLQYNAVATAKEPSSGITPLHIAFEKDLAEVARSLLKHGADPAIQDKRGKTPRDLLTFSSPLEDLIRVFDSEGYAGFEDAPGTWIKQLGDNGQEFYASSSTGEARWTPPPSCTWSRTEAHGHPFHYINRLTGQQMHTIPKALSWRRVQLDGELVWYNWVSNHTQHATPAELPADLLDELSDDVNVRWHNTVTGELSWADPRHHDEWRVGHDGDTGAEFYFNVKTGESSWEKPEELSWEVLEDAETKRSYFHNAKTGITQWLAPPHLAWQRHDSEL